MLIRLVLSIFFCLLAGLLTAQKPNLILKTCAEAALAGAHDGELRELKEIAGVKLGDTSTTVLQFGKPQLAGDNFEFELYAQGWAGLNHSTYLDCHTAFMWDSSGKICSIVVGIMEEALTAERTPVAAAEEPVVREPPLPIPGKDFKRLVAIHGMPMLVGNVVNLDIIGGRYPTAKYGWWGNATKIVIFTESGGYITEMPMGEEELAAVHPEFRRRGREIFKRDGGVRPLY